MSLASYLERGFDDVVRVCTRDLLHVQRHARLVGQRRQEVLRHLGGKGAHALGGEVPAVQAAVGAARKVQRHLQAARARP